ncbi:MAG: hypothetical protein ACE5H9_12530 [Anaerolineae bacterium]
MANRDITDIPHHFLKEVARCFEAYKDLEGVRGKPIGWELAAAVERDARRLLVGIRTLY